MKTIDSVLKEPLLVCSLSSLSMADFSWLSSGKECINFNNSFAPHPKGFSFLLGLFFFFLILVKYTQYKIHY